MKLTSIIVILISLNACTKNENIQGIDKAFDLTLDTLRIDLKTAGYTIDLNKISIQFGKISDHSEETAAICYKQSGKNIIIVEREFWEQYWPLTREYILAHEIGHCVLNREHNNKLHFDGSPVSIMYKDATIPAKYSSDYHREYFKELVSKQ